MLQNLITLTKGKASIAHYNTWEGSHDYLGGEEHCPLPGIYLANFALAHSLNVDLSSRDDYFRRNSETARFWRREVMKYLNITAVENITDPKASFNG